MAPPQVGQGAGADRFEGYRAERRPADRASSTKLARVQVQDLPFERRRSGGVTLDPSAETLDLTDYQGRPKNLYFRAAVGKKIEALGDGTGTSVDGEWKVRIGSPTLKPILRESAGKTELILSRQAGRRQGADRRGVRLVNN